MLRVSRAGRRGDAEAPPFERVSSILQRFSRTLVRPDEEDARLACPADEAVPAVGLVVVVGAELDDVTEVSEGFDEPPAALWVAMPEEASPPAGSAALRTVRLLGRAFESDAQLR